MKHFSGILLYYKVFKKTKHEFSNVILIVVPIGRIYKQFFLLKNEIHVQI